MNAALIASCRDAAQHEAWVAMLADAPMSWVEGVKYARSTREAFPVERFPAMFGPYSRPTFARQLARFSAWFGAFAFIGVLLAWRL